jgi:hypothetical protein
MRRLSGNKPLLMVLFSFFAVAISSAVSPDPRLLPLVPPGAQIVAGMSAPSGKGQPDSFLLITHNNTVDLDDFFALSGVDDSRTIHQIIFVAAADRTGNLGEHSLLVSGHFDQSRIFRSAVDGGASIDAYRGTSVLAVKPFAREPGAIKQVRWLAIFEPNVVIFGTIASVQQELDRHLAGSVPDSSLLQRLGRLRREDETWCLLASAARSAEIRNALEAVDPRLAALVQNGGGFQFGIHFGGHVEFEYEVTPSSGANAQVVGHSLGQSLAGPGAGASSFSARPDTTAGGDSVHGVVQLSKNRYDAWLKEVSARRSQLLPIESASNDCSRAAAEQQA